MLLLGVLAWSAAQGKLTDATAPGKPVPLQPLIDRTPPNGTLRLPPGRYAGPVVIDKPMVLDGQGKATIDAGGKGSVILLKTNGAEIRNLHLTHSGTSYNDIDAGIQVRGRYNVIQDNRIDDCLFGIDMQQSDNNIVRRNYIRSKPFPLGQRGDGIRLWYSFHNRIEDNVLDHVRDMVVWYSANNEIRRNRSSHSRYSLHFMYSRYNLVENNHYTHNAVGIFLMYSDSVVVRNNTIAHAVGPSGIGIGFKETSDLTIEGNRILYCASGMYLDVSPFQPGTTNRITGNTVAYNAIGMRFLNDWHGNLLHDNNFVDNLTQVAVTGGKTANHNEWRRNYWSDYAGFDRNRDGIGDTPYVLRAYADRLWQDEPYAQFFKGSPMLEVLDYLQRLAPFSPPRVLVTDAAPRMRPFHWKPARPRPKPQGEPTDALEILLRSLGREE
ncbi:MAG: nitrous oxide reductase family maturation protein NosD [Gammaproteobacteria bacterium]|nr:MAG: nitrous oxide reductase family maturation protein NosD [Gammaproteobacteria bacterium]